MDRKDVKLPADAPTAFLADKHVEYIVGWNKDKESYEYTLSEYLRVSGLYWCMTALDVLGASDRIPAKDVVAFVQSCYVVDAGGYAPSPGNDPHLLSTLSAVQLLVMYDALPPPPLCAAISAFVADLQEPDGSFRGDAWGEIDTRFSFCALACLKLLGQLDIVRVDDAAAYILRCMNFDGGFGVGPESESHAGQIYCCVSALAIAGESHRIDADRLAWWLCERQLESGGFNGRPEKLPDVCYSWWVLSSLTTLDRLHWIDQDKLRRFILACQDSETGGFADRPGDMVDPFHTLFGTAALSLLGDTTLKKINPIFCMTQEVIDRALGDAQPSYALL